MTKRKTGVFRGGWADGRLTQPAPIPRFLEGLDPESECPRNKAMLEELRRLKMNAWQDEITARNKVAQYIRSFDRRADTVSIICALSRQLEIWRFDQKRIETEPEQAEWARLIAGIRITDAPTHAEAFEICQKVRRLPLRVLAVLDAALFKAAKVGRIELLDRLYFEPTASDARLLRDTLTAMRESLAYVSGKRGPKLKKISAGPAFRAVTAAIIRHSSLKKNRAMELAAALLNERGVDVPKGTSQQYALMKK